MCNYKKSYFSLLELIAVLMIVSLVATVAIVNVAKMPVFLSLDNVVSEIKLIFIEASKQALAQGKEIVVECDLEGKRFSLNAPIPENIFDTDPEQEPKHKKPDFKYALPKDVELKAGTYSRSGNKLTFHFYSDGSADGPEIIIKMKKHAYSINISPLTGAVDHIEIEDDI